MMEVIMEENLNIVIVGMGMIGSECARELLNRGMNIVGAVDSYDKIIGMDLGQHLNVSKLGVAIESDLDKGIKKNTSGFSHFMYKNYIT